MTEAPRFPQVVVHNGQVDAHSGVIAINTRDQVISRGAAMVHYGHAKKGANKSFLLASFMLSNHPRSLSSNEMLRALYGDDPAGWPRDLHNAVGRPMYDLRHRAGRKLGLVVVKSGLSRYSLVLRNMALPLVEELQESRVAQGRAKPNRPGVRTFGVEFETGDAETIRRFAVRENCSFQEAVRVLVTWGLESATQQAPATGERAA